MRPPHFVHPSRRIDNRVAERAELEGCRLDLEQCRVELPACRSDFLAHGDERGHPQRTAFRILLRTLPTAETSRMNCVTEAVQLWRRPIANARVSDRHASVTVPRDGITCATPEAIVQAAWVSRRPVHSIAPLFEEERPARRANAGHARYSSGPFAAATWQPAGKGGPNRRDELFHRREDELDHALRSVRASAEIGPSAYAIGASVRTIASFADASRHETQRIALFADVSRTSCRANRLHTHAESRWA
jgi:hypothetical protein